MLEAPAASPGCQKGHGQARCPPCKGLWRGGRLTRATVNQLKLRRSLLPREQGAGQPFVQHEPGTLKKCCVATAARLIRNSWHAWQAVRPQGQALVSDLAAYGADVAHTNLPNQDSPGHLSKWQLLCPQEKTAQHTPGPVVR